MVIVVSGRAREASASQDVAAVTATDPGEVTTMDTMDTKGRTYLNFIVAPQ
jgi:hypothetical protein